MVSTSGLAFLHSGYPGHAAEKEWHQIKIEEAYQTPVYRADNGDGKGCIVQCFVTHGTTSLLWAPGGCFSPPACDNCRLSEEKKISFLIEVAFFFYYGEVFGFLYTLY